MHYSNQTSNILGSARTQVYLIESNFEYITPILSHENLSDRGSYRKFGESRTQESENLMNRGRSLKTTPFANSTLKILLTQLIHFYHYSRAIVLNKRTQVRNVWGNSRKNHSFHHIKIRLRDYKKSSRLELYAPMSS